LPPSLLPPHPLLSTAASATSNTAAGAAATAVTAAATATAITVSAAAASPAISPATAATSATTAASAAAAAAYNTATGTIATALAAATTAAATTTAACSFGHHCWGRLHHTPLPASAFAVAIPIHCLGHHCGIVADRLCCHWFFLQSPETASVEELCTYSNVGIFFESRILWASVFFKFCGKRIKLFSQFKLFLSNLVIQIVSHKSASVYCCLVIHNTL
jgi:hypothetical protein